MASDGSDQDARYALSNLLQMGTVAEYEIIAKPNDLNIAVQVQDIEETTLHTSDKVEAVSTSMVATYEEHGCQDGFVWLLTIRTVGGPPDHMRASEKEFVVLKSPLEQKSMFMRQERMLRRQEQQRLTKDAKIQRRIWDPRIKSIQDNTLRASDQDARYTLSKLLQRGTVTPSNLSMQRNIEYPRA
ncbi:hypothetical protein Tco_0359805, partial [Tanacetum coccineum]